MIKSLLLLDILDILFDNMFLVVSIILSVVNVIYHIFAISFYGTF